MSFKNDRFFSFPLCLCLCHQEDPWTAELTPSLSQPSSPTGKYFLVRSSRKLLAHLAASASRSTAGWHIRQKAVPKFGWEAHKSPRPLPPFPPAGKNGTTCSSTVITWPGSGRQASAVNWGAAAFGACAGRQEPNRSRCPIWFDQSSFFLLPATEKTAVMATHRPSSEGSSLVSACWNFAWWERALTCTLAVCSCTWRLFQKTRVSGSTRPRSSGASMRRSRRRWAWPPSSARWEEESPAAQSC